MCEPFKRFKVPIDTWSSLPKTKRDSHFKRFMKKLHLKDTKTVFTSDGKRVFTGPGANGGKKPHQRKRKRAAKTTTVSKKRLV